MESPRGADELEVKMVKVWKCSACGYESEGGLRPRKCPKCGADAFDHYDYDDEDEDEDDEEG